MIQTLKKHSPLLIAAAAIAIAVISVLFLQKEKKETEPSATPPLTAAATPEPTPVPTTTPAEISMLPEIPAPSPTARPAPTATPTLTYSPDAAAALPQDELEYTLADPTPAPTAASADSQRGTFNDDPNLREELELLIRYVRAELPGVWVGSFGDGREWRLQLDPAYGNYELRVGDELETGSFTMEHRIETFHTTLHFTPGGDDQAQHDLQICLATIDGHICLIPKNAEYPTFYREE